MGTILETPCRFFMGPRDRDGYGIAGKRGRLHRWVWEQVNGPIPPGMHVLHRCDNPPCFRLDHLFLGTTLDNNRDRAAKGRSNPARDRSLLTDDQVREIRQIKRDMPWHTQRALAERFGVSEFVIHFVVTGKTYRHLL